MAMLDKDRYSGVCVVTGVPSLGSRYERVRVGDIDEYQLAAHIEATAYLRRDIIPLAAPTMRDVSSPADAVPADSVPQQKPRTTRRKSA